jgi:hypothetical protein
MRMEHLRTAGGGITGGAAFAVGTAFMAGATMGGGGNTSGRSGAGGGAIGQARASPLRARSSDVMAAKRP